MDASKGVASSGWLLLVTLILGCAHQKVAEPKPVVIPTQAKQSGAPGDSGPAVPSTPSTTEVHTIPKAGEPRACNGPCPENLWECACAFALKAGPEEPVCREEFVEDHGTDCAQETLEECLVVVMRRAEARHDFELAKATMAALQCVRSEAGAANKKR